MIDVGHKIGCSGLLESPENGFDKQRLDFEEVLELFDVVDEIIGSDNKAKRELYGSFDNAIFHENYTHEEFEEDWGHLLPKDGEPKMSDETRVSIYKQLLQSMPRYTLDQLEPIVAIADTMDSDTLAELITELKHCLYNESIRSKSLLTTLLLTMADRLKNEEMQVKIALAEFISTLAHCASFDARACAQSPTDMVLKHFEAKFPTFDFAKLKDVWLIRLRDQLDPTQSIGKDLQRAVELERAMPGATNVVMEEFNIHNIGRYPVELLIDQIRYRYDTLSPYLLLYSSGSDWNGAKHTDSEIDNLKDINCQLSGLGYRFRIAEFHSLEMLTEAQERFAQQYENPIEDVIIDAHGWKDGFSFAKIRKTMTEQEKYARTIRTCDFDDPSTAPFNKECYAISSTFIFFACSTGLEGGVAQAASRSLGCTTIAPEDSAHLKSMAITKSECGLMFETEYENSDDYDGPLPVKTAIYKNGVKIQ